MALINCEHCGHSISDKAPFCPKCGFLRVTAVSEESLKQQGSAVRPTSKAPLKTPKGLWAMGIIGLLILAGGIIWFIMDINNRHEQYLADLEYQRLERLRIEEQQRLDSIRMDSILAVQKAEEERLERGKLHLDDVLKYDKSEGYLVKGSSSLKKTLEAKGYVLSGHKRYYVDESSWGDYWEEKWTYVFYKNNETKSDPLFKVTFYDNDCALEITIPDKDLFNEFKSEIKSKNLVKLPGGGVDEWKRVDYKGNMIWINFCGD